MADQFASIISLEFELPFSKGSKKGCQEELMKLSIRDNKTEQSICQI
jgi:hypothetical protein